MNPFFLIIHFFCYFVGDKVSVVQGGMGQMGKGPKRSNSEDSLENMVRERERENGRESFSSEVINCIFIGLSPHVFNLC